MRRKEKPLDEQTDTEVRTLIAMGRARIARLKQEQADIEAKIKKWQRVLKDRERQCRRG